MKKPKRLLLPKRLSGPPLPRGTRRVPPAQRPRRIYRANRHIRPRKNIWQATKVEVTPMKLGLSLGGGGARGSATIGVLMELELMGIRPDLITGTSVGAIIGAMLSAGLTPTQMADSIRSVQPIALYALPQDGRSITSNERVEAMLVKRFVDHFGEDHFEGRAHQRPTFDDLDIPLAVVATDLVTHQEIVIDSGDLVRALVASASVPVLFPPVPYADRMLVDGGMVNNLPVDVARSRGALFTIGVDLSYAAPYTDDFEQIESEEHKRLFNLEWAELISGKIFDRALYNAARQPLWRVVTSLMDIVTTQNSRLNSLYNPPDVLIRPYMGEIGLLDFHMADKGIEAGRKAVHRAAPDIERLLTRMAHLRQLEAEDNQPE